MNVDRNSIIGFILLALLFFAYFYFTSKEQAAYQKMKLARQRIEQARIDSLKKLNQSLQDSVSGVQDSLLKNPQSDALLAISDSVEKTVWIENALMKVTFTNKGGRIKMVELKQYKGLDNNPVKLGGTDFDNLSYTIHAGNAHLPGTAASGSLFFKKIDTITQADGSKMVTFTLAEPDSNGRSLTHQYIIRPDDYMIDFIIKMKGADRLLTQGILNLTWQYAAVQQEPDISYEKQNTQVGYVENGSFDYHTIGRKSRRKFDEKVSWIGVRQRFFYAILTAKDQFTYGEMEWNVPPDAAMTVVRFTANMKLSVPAEPNPEVSLSLYYGPSDYHILKKYGKKYDKLINLGQGPYAFVRPVNKYLIVPIFDVFINLVKNPGIAIVLLTLIIRLLISPLTYSSYLSGAKMKALRPEITKLREKYGNDPQTMSIEQMKLFREAGVNPLGGCIPALLQIPIFFALFSFFNSEPSLRGAGFLWASDLSAYDDPIKFGFKIPLLGGHLSLFNFLACVTSFLISWYSMSMTPDQSNPVLKYMPYFFPVFLLFFFNHLPAGLTWYYTVSNLITLGLQFVIQNFIIDQNKVLAKIEENRKKPKPKSRWQQRLEQMQEQQKKLRELRQRGHQ